MKDFYPVLMQSPLFSGIEEGNLGAMLSCLGARVMHYAKGENILTEGGPANCLGVILSGCAQVYRLDISGNRSLMAIAGPSEIFAEAFAFADTGTLPVSVSALEECDALLISASRIAHPCAQACGFHQRMIYNLMRILALKNIACNEKIEVTSKRSTREKLMTYLQLQAKKAQCSTFTIPFDRQALADYLEVERSGLSAEIGKLRREGALKSEKSTFTLL